MYPVGRLVLLGLDYMTVDSVIAVESSLGIMTLKIPTADYLETSLPTGKPQ